MYWPFPEIPDIFQSKPHSGWGRMMIWTIPWMVFVLLVITVILFWDLDWLYLTIPIVITIIVIFVMSFNRYFARDAWEKEKANIQKSWIDWANQSITLIDSDIVLPDDLSAEGIISQMGTRYEGDCFIFPRDKEGELTVFTSKIGKEFAARLVEFFSYNQFVTIHIAVRDVDIYDNLERVFLETAHQVDFFKLAVVHLTDQQNLLNDWFEREFEGIHVVFSLLLNEDNELPLFTENLTWLVFAPDDWIKKQNISIKQYFQRPLDILGVEGVEKSVALQHFCQYAVNNHCINALWLPGLSFDERLSWADELQTSGIIWKPSTFKTVVYQPELYMGNIATTDYWGMLALAADNYEPIQIFGWQNRDVFQLALIKLPRSE